MNKSGLKPINREQGVSLHQLSKWNKQLDMQRLKTIHDQEDIKKQKKIAKQSSSLVNSSIQQIEQEASSLSKQLEEQKTKHEHLLILVKNAEQQIYAQKLQKYEDVINKKQPDEFQEQKNILKEKQKKLEKVLEKLNSSDFQFSKKVDTIRALRRERAMHSNMFDKLEKQYFDVEFYYKQLVIQRIFKQKQLEELIEDFNKVQQKFSALPISIKRESSQETNIGLIYSPQDQGRNSLSKFHDSRLRKEKQNNFPQNQESKKQLDDEIRNAQQVKKLDIKKKIKKIFNDLECHSFDDFLKKDFSSIIQAKEQFFTQSNNYYDEIFNLKEEIKKLQKELDGKKLIKGRGKNRKATIKQTEVQNTQQEIENQKNEISSFGKQLYSIVKKTLDDKKIRQIQNVDHFQSVLKRVQTDKIEKKSFSQTIETLKSVMAYFNTQVLNKSFPSHCHNPNTPISRGPADKNKKTKTKRFSLSKLNIDKKSKTNESQKLQSIQEIRMKDSQCLNQILMTFQNNSEKATKTQKYQHLTLMSESQMIEEGKKLVAQIQKKKIQSIDQGLIDKK